MDIPQDLLDKLQAAESALGEARSKDGDLEGARSALEAAKTAEEGARADALQAHQSANALAADAVAAVRAHFGLE